MTIGDHRRDQEIQTAIRNLLLGAVPERSAEIDDICQQLQAEFTLEYDEKGESRFLMEAGLYRHVRFNHRALRAFWFAGFIAWEGYRAIADGVLAGTTPDLVRFSSWLKKFSAILSDETTEERPLPDGLPEPGTYVEARDDASMQSSAAAQLATFATAWALLHEVRHLRHQQDGTAADSFDPDPAGRRTEEISCDEFATKFLLEKAPAYAASKKVSIDLVQQKRQLGIYFALLGLAVISENKWDETNTHPSVRTRMDAIRAAMSSGASATAEAVAMLAFAALKAVWPLAPDPFS